MLEVKIINKSRNAVPAYATSGSSGMDLRANIPNKDNGVEDSIKIPPGERRLVPTGIYIALPEGFEAQIRPRSGLAIRHGITVLNAPGTVDADYRGEIMVNLINHGTADIYVGNGDRIAQMVVAKVEKISFKEVETLDDTDRGSGGHGSTGLG